MSEYSLEDSPPSQRQLDNETPSYNISLDETTNAANNSIIGKVKSRVSSILPNRLSKWFSPSTKIQNDELNGSVTTTIAKRRRRLEVEEEDDDEIYDEDITTRRRGEYEENHNLISKPGEHSDAEDDEEEDDDESQNSEEEYNATLAAQKGRQQVYGRQPPAKRSRLNVETRDSPLIAPRRPLIASTPAVGSPYTRNSIGTGVASRSSYQRYTHLNLYGNQNRKEPAYIFSQQKERTDIIDLVSQPPNETDDKIASQSNVYNRSGISSRRSLNIPSTSSPRLGADRTLSTGTHLKRQPTNNTDLSLTLTTSAGVPPRRTSTTIHEVQDSEERNEYNAEDHAAMENSMQKYNGQINDATSSLYTTIKRPRQHVNGSGFNAPDIPEIIEEAILLDTASESGESGTAEIKKSNPQRKAAGLFNMSGTGGTTGNSSRTSSFGNGLNFYSHLEGRKSLFTGPGNGVSNPLNNSSLSLTSLNRRQFNASIYGSTSALSDSRLLNTFSPFYKGKTTYGGAAAYNKYAAGAGASAVRITPTLIRPTSSLSTLSSSNHSLATTTNSHQIGDSSAISSTAKRILDLINDFATPLSEAKKMAGNLKTNNANQHIQAKGRLNESDLNASRAMRLSQVRTPYARPTVILQPSGNANNVSRAILGGPMPPVKELQVPTMSQLLQMKKIQNTTENARKITRNTITDCETSEYTLPATHQSDISKSTAVVGEANRQKQQLQQKHTNKIKNKVTNTLRASAANKDLEVEAPPPSVNLPNIAFPLMPSVPKFDIQFAASTANIFTGSKSSSTLGDTKPATSSVVTNSALGSQTAFTTTKSLSSVETTSKSGQATPRASIWQSGAAAAATPIKNNFKFSEPLVVKGTPSQNVAPTNFNNYKFSPPLEVTLTMTPNTTKLQPQQPQLKTTGSCLDVLNKPLSFAASSTTITTPKTAVATTQSPAVSFGNQFKKSSSEWECDVCMIRNKEVVSKCVACETPRKQQGTNVASNSLLTKNTTSLPPSTFNTTSSFGQQFKKSSSEWECDACMIRNKEEHSKCVACETPRKGLAAASSAPVSLPPIKNSFGNAFKPKSGNWECSTCMINNKSEVNECVACQTKKPGTDSLNSSCSGPNITAATSSFKFGFAQAQTGATPTAAADVGFKTIAAKQLAAKWECDACMTRNDAERTKCACCEQPKPGSSGTEESSSSSSSTTTTKFAFGATSAAKFSFGFGNGPNAAKEEELRKTNTTEEKKTTPPTTNTVAGNTLPNTSFQFGIKPTMTQNQEKKKDETDAKTSQPTTISNVSGAGFKFGASADLTKKSETPATATTGFTFGSKPTESTPKTTPAAAATAPSVKFNLPTAVTAANNSAATANKPAGIVAPTFSFGTNSASSTTEGFGLGKSPAKNPTVTVPEKNAVEGFAFKTPSAVSSSTNMPSAPKTGFVFGSPSAAATNKNSVVLPNNTKTTTGESTNTTTSTASMFTAVNTPATTTAGFGGFSFGSNSTPTASSGKTLFGAVTSTSSNTINAASTNTSTTPAPGTTNLFGGLTSGTPTFGSSAAVSAANPPANNSTTVSSSTNNNVNNPTTGNATPTFGSFASNSQSTTNVFGSFSGGSQTNQSQNKPIATPVFGNVASSSNNSQTASPKSFVFGSSTNSTPLANTVASSSTTTTTASVTNAGGSGWPKNSFVFGSPSSTATTQATNANKEAPKVFGSFGSGGGGSNSNQQTTSIFGNPAPLSNIASSPAPAFGNTTASSANSNTNLFSVNSAPAATTNIFGATNPSGNAVTPAPAFGSSSVFGGSASATSATPTFGSTANSATFGGFGATAGNATNTTEVKKPEPAFNFGSAPQTQQTTTGGFNFGSTTAPTKTFNFGGAAPASQPSFNFTGAPESQNPTKPFQFGVIPSAPVFNFGGGAIEATPNAPFQFNAGTAPVSSNIFAPAPTPGTQTAQQAKRKIRAPIRRVTQR